MTPAVSVVIPTCRRPEPLRDAIESVLSQDLPLECVVVDDDPAGSGRDTVAEFGGRARYVWHQPASGGRPAPVRNLGRRHASAPVLMFLDDDDRLLPGSLRRLTAALDGEGRPGVAFGRVRPFGEDALALQREHRYQARAAERARAAAGRVRAVASLLFRPTFLVCSTAVLRADVFDAIGGFDTGLPLFEDVEMYMRAIRAAGHRFLDEDVVEYRTGNPKLMAPANAGGGDAGAYASMHRRYRREHGVAEFLGLRLLAAALPA